MMDRYGEHGWEMGFGMGWWWIIGLIILVIIVWIVVKVINKANNSNTRLGNKSALDILKERYARNESSKQEFEQLKKDLM